MVLRYAFAFLALSGLLLEVKGQGRGVGKSGGFRPPGRDRDSDEDDRERGSSDGNNRGFPGGNRGNPGGSRGGPPNGRPVRPPSWGNPRPTRCTPVDCEMGPWSSWSRPCLPDCTRRMRIRYRGIARVNSCGGRRCSGDRISLHKCPAICRTTSGNPAAPLSTTTTAHPSSTTITAAASTTSSTTASTAASTTSSTTASTAASTTSSTTASTAPSTTASTTASTAPSTTASPPSTTVTTTSATTTTAPTPAPTTVPVTSEATTSPDDSVTNTCLNCICQVDGCDEVTECPSASTECGPYELTEDYWNMCGQPRNDYKTCAVAKRCSKRCVREYTRTFIDTCLSQLPRSRATCKDYALIHRYGRDGCLRSEFDSFWQEVKSCCDNRANPC